MKNPRDTGRNGKPLPELGLIPALLIKMLVGISLGQVEMTPVAAFWEGFNGTFPCGDANHSGQCEIYGTSDHNHDSLIIYENQGGNSYRTIKTGIRIHEVRDFGRGDGDSLAEIISDATIYRALDPDTFPTESVYHFSPPCGAIFTKFTDLDQDGRREIAFGSNGVNGSGINLYENRGLDQWVQVPFPPSDAEGQFAFADLDRDGATEIVSGDAGGNLYIFKCLGDDQYFLIESTHLATDIESYCCSAADDMDGDSLPEFIILSLDTRNWMCNVRVCEAAPESIYQCVWSTQIPRGNEWYWSIGAGDVDADGRDEFAVTTGSAVILFKSTGRHEYEQVWQYRPGGEWVRFFDLNRDGRDELIISPCSTYIFEDTAGLGLEESWKTPRVAVTVGVQPTIARTGKPVQFGGLLPGAELEIVSTSGRLVRRGRAKGNTSWQWDLRDESGLPVPVGTYYCIVRAKGQATSLKLCVVK